MARPHAAPADPAPLLRSDRGGVVTLTLNRPQRYNALDEALLGQLATTLDSLADDEAARVVVLAAAGRAFCAGHDLHEMRAHRSRERHADLFARCSRMMRRLTEIPQPVIARVHGLATAAGCQLVAACDLAVASTGARFAVSGIRQGLFCSTPSVALGRNVGRKQAFEMLVTGDFVDAHEALARGLVNRVVEPDALDAAVDGLARAVVEKPRAAVAIGKRLFYRQLETDLESAYRLAGEAMAANMMDADAIEGIDAFLAKRPPSWADRDDG